MHARRCITLHAALLLLCSTLTAATAQTAPTPAAPAVTPQATIGAVTQQTADMLGLSSSIATLGALQSQSRCDAAPTLGELAIRQQLLESVEVSALDVDDVLNELSDEQSKLSELRASLQSRRNRTVSLLNAAAIITGTGLGAAISATQFTTLSTTAQNVGNGVGIGSGAASTLLSYLALRKQAGPKTSVGTVPNMLAPLFSKPPVLRTYYPPVVLLYLNTVPAGEPPTRGTRLEQLREQWVASGRLDPSRPSKEARQIVAASSSMDPNVKVAINDLTARMSMLEDVGGRVAFLKRDLAMLMHLYLGKRPCQTP